MIQIETERLLIRPMQIGDIEALAAIWTDPDVTRYMGGPRNYAELRLSFDEDLRSGLASDLDLWPVVEKASGQVVGHCGLLDKEVEGRAEVELIYILARPAWGQGYATEAASALKAYAFERLGLERIIALIDPQNVASERAAVKAGMHYEKDTVRPGGKTMRIYAAYAGSGGQNKGQSWPEWKAI